MLDTYQVTSSLVASYRFWIRAAFTAELTLSWLALDCWADEDSHATADHIDTYGRMNQSFGNLPYYSGQKRMMIWIAAPRYLILQTRVIEDS